MRRLINDVEYVYDQHHQILKMKRVQRQLEPINHFKILYFFKESKYYFMKHDSHKDN
jgi:hypothetical protein